MSVRRVLGSTVAVVFLVAVAASVALAAGTFTDDDGNTHEGNIEAIAAEGITKGCNPPTNDLYCPDDPVTRGQMAAFLHRALKGKLTPGDPVDFVDDDGSIFEADIEWLGATGVTKGCNPPDNDQYCPDDFVTRGQMAAFLHRGFDDILTPTEMVDFVDDDGSTFEADISWLGGTGVTKGCNPPDNTEYCPDELVLRDQMASFLARALDLDPITPTTTTTTTTTTLAPGEFEDFTVSGSGNDVVDLKIPGDVPAILDISHDGSSNFAMWSLDASFGNIDLLVNVIGTYDGQRPVNAGWFSSPQYVRHLDIDADGSWSITARPMSKARALTTSLSGSGDEVVRNEGSASTLTSTHDGSENFIILGYESSGEYNELIVNVIGNYSGTDLIDSATDILDIQADGNWTLHAP